jgi:hypothetical protein
MQGQAEQPATMSEPQVEPSRNLAYMELVRRVLTLLLFVAGAAVAFNRQAEVLVVEPAALADRYLSSTSTDPVVQFANSRLESVYVVEGETWDKLVESLETTGRRKAKGGVYQYYPRSHEWFGPRVGTIIVQRGPQRRVLTVTPMTFGSMSSYDPPAFRMRYPHLFFGLPILLLAAVPYLLLRWKPGHDDAYHGGSVTVTLDVLGGIFALLAAVALGTVADKGAGQIVGLGLAVALIALTIVGPCGYYAGLRARALSDRIRVMSLFGTTEFPYRRISMAQIRQETQSPALAILLIVFGVSNCVSAVFGVLMLIRKHQRLTIHRDDGKTFRMWVKGSKGVMENLVSAMSTHGVPMNVQE